jgi:hypothetical protein
VLSQDVTYKRLALGLYIVITLAAGLAVGATEADGRAVSSACR